MGTTTVIISCVVCSGPRLCARSPRGCLTSRSVLFFTRRKPAEHRLHALVWRNRFWKDENVKKCSDAPEPVPASIRTSSSHLIISSSPRLHKTVRLQRGVEALRAKARRDQIKLLTVFSSFQIIMTPPMQSRGHIVYVTFIFLVIFSQL